jgi:dihydroflavonol-4-reductase
VHITDVVAGHLAALERGATGQRYILGGENLTHMQLLALIADVTGVPAPNQVLPTRMLRAAAGPAELLQSFLHLPIAANLLRLAGYYFFYDTRKMQADLGIETARPIRDAIAEAHAWFRQP